MLYYLYILCVHSTVSWKIVQRILTDSRPDWSAFQRTEQQQFAKSPPRLNLEDKRTRIILKYNALKTEINFIVEYCNFARCIDKAWRTPGKLAMATDGRRYEKPLLLIFLCADPNCFARLYAWYKQVILCFLFFFSLFSEWMGSEWKIKRTGSLDKYMKRHYSFFLYASHRVR